MQILAVTDVVLRYWVLAVMATRAIGGTAPAKQPHRCPVHVETTFRASLRYLIISSRPFDSCYELSYIMSLSSHRLHRR
jgi:hypothetical protein